MHNAIQKTVVSRTTLFMPFVVAVVLPAKNCPLDDRQGMPIRFKLLHCWCYDLILSWRVFHNNNEDDMCITRLLLQQTRLKIVHQCNFPEKRDQQNSHSGNLLNKSRLWICQTEKLETQHEFRQLTNWVHSCSQWWVAHDTNPLAITTGLVPVDTTSVSGSQPLSREWTMRIFPLSSPVQTHWCE